MIVEFRVKNFLSIKDEQVFSMAADDSLDLNDSRVTVENANAPALLKSAAIYGANASGKSNLIEAVVFMFMKLMNDTYPMHKDLSSKKDFAEQLSNFVRFRPYKLDAQCQNIPSEFEITFLYNAVKYQYGFSLNKERIVSEWLIVYPKGAPQKWFERIYDDVTGKYTYTTSKYFKGQKSVYEETTRDDALYLATAVLLNNQQLTEVYNAMCHIKVLNKASGKNVICGRVMEYLAENPKFRKKFIDLLKKADVGIADLKIVKQSNNGRLASRVAETDDSEEDKASKKHTIYRPIFVHENKDTKQNAEFRFFEESVGTQKFFGLICDLLFAVERGEVLLVDELETSLHPALTKAIVELFNSAENKEGQLIFTTHSVELMLPDIFRHDQIWFVEKHTDGASEIYPLTDFSPAKDEKIANRYLAGCYGAIPFVRRFVSDEGK